MELCNSSPDQAKVLRRMRILLSILLIAILQINYTYSQHEFKYGSSEDRSLPEWVREMYKENPDPGKVMSLYDAYYDRVPFVKNNHTQYYKRWLRSITRATEHSKRNNRSKAPNRTTDWTCIGPFDWDHEAAGRSYAPGSAHVYVVEQSISNEDVLYAGTATAGLYKTEDRGLNWVPLTDDMDVNSVYALEIDHTNPNIVYASMLGTVMKTTDGGATWNFTGNAAFQSTYLSIRDIMMDPTNANIIIIATDQGIYRTTNAGTSWTEVYNGNGLEIEFHPTDVNTVYAVEVAGNLTNFLRSTNNGQNFSIVGTGWPNQVENKRAEIHVSPDEPDYVFAHLTGAVNGGEGLYGIYKSTDKGDNWTFECCGPQPGGLPDLDIGNYNIMGWSKNGAGDGGQYYYDVAFGVSPYNADSIWAAGVNLWVSGDQGASFECKASWSEPQNQEYVHADIHDFHYYEHSGEIWIGCDGGIFYSNNNGVSFERRVFGIAGTDFWGFDTGWWEGDIMLGGVYHNGTHLKENNVYINDWICTDGGDGNYGRVNPGRPKNVHSWFNIKDLQSDRTIAPVTRGNPHKANASYIVGQDSDLLFHPYYYDTWWTGSDSLLVKTTDNGYSFEILYDFIDYLAALAIAPSNPDVIYAATWPDWWVKKEIYRSTDGGNTFTLITPPEAMLGNNFHIPYDILVDHEDPMKITVARTSMSNEYLNNNWLYQSTDGGNTWNNISGSTFINESATRINENLANPGGIYVSTRKGVWYKDDSMADFEDISSDLPVSTFSEVIVPYYRKSKIRNATNRSVWERSAANLPTQVIARPSAQTDTLQCTSDTVYFRDISVVTDQGVSWQWEFPGGSPSTSTEQNPKIVYENPGIYDVTLTVTDIYGSDTKTIPAMITVMQDCDKFTGAGNALETYGSGDYVQVNNVSWQSKSFTMTAWIKPAGIQNDYSGIFMADGSAAGLNFKNGSNELGYHWPGGAWSWNSGLFVPQDEWSHVAMVVTQENMTLYLNGEKAVHNTNLNAADISSFKIGSYQGWNSRNFVGQIDEMAMYLDALTQEQIREIRHLKKYPEEEVNLVGYYEFDVLNSTIAYDNSTSGNDGNFNNNASVVPSFAPVGYGTSTRLTIDPIAGEYIFPEGGMTFTFNGSSTPDGEVVVSHILSPPAIKPNSNASVLRGYHIINNYGNNATFNGLSKIKFINAGTITDYMANNAMIELFSRSENEGENPWNSESSGPFTSTTGIFGEIELTDAEGITSFGQFFANRAPFPLTTSSVTMKANEMMETDIEGGQSSSLALVSENQGMVLPRIDQTYMETYNVTEGAFAYWDEMNKIVFYDGTAWKEVVSKATFDYTSNPLPGQNTGMNMGALPHDESSLLNLSESTGLIVLPSYTTSDLVNIETPTQRMMIYNSDEKEIQLFKNAIWKNIESEVIDLIPGTQTPPSIEGFAVDQNFKAPEAIIQLNNLQNKAFSLPQAGFDKITVNNSGLLLFDPAAQELMLFNGSTWNKVCIVE